jgi:hypothetical protein
VARPRKIIDGQTLSVRVPGDVRTDLRAIALVEKKDLSQLMREVLVRYAKRRHNDEAVAEARQLVERFDL